MRNKHQKKLQSRVNKHVRAMNKNIYNDNLWLGRFYAHQIAASYHQYEDNSGGSLLVWLELRDRKTGKKKVEILDVFGSGRFLGNDLFRIMNSFIVDYVDVWRNENPYKDERIDYRKEK